MEKEVISLLVEEKRKATAQNIQNECLLEASKSLTISADMAKQIANQQDQLARQIELNKSYIKILGEKIDQLSKE